MGKALAKGGLKLGHRLIKVFNWCFLRRPTHTRRPPERETHPMLKPNPKSKPQGYSISRTMRRWVSSLKEGARRLCLFSRPKSPKGQLAVYVAGDEGGTCRVMVPVVYLNHPLFGELLKEAEKEYGFNHHGVIKIPCPKSKLESVQMKIAAGSSCRRGRS